MINFFDETPKRREKPSTKKPQTKRKKQHTKGCPKCGSKDLSTVTNWQQKPIGAKCNNCNEHYTLHDVLKNRWHESYGLKV